MKKAPKEAVAAIRKAIANGRVEWVIPEKHGAPVTVGSWTFTAVNIAEAWKHKRGCGFRVSWSVENCGFGTADFHQDSDGNIRVDDECMGREFMAALLTALLTKTSLSSEWRKRENRVSGTTQ